MKKALLIIVFAYFAGIISGYSQEKNVKVKIKTEFGDITCILYNETPKHRDNFIKLAESGFYNGSIFHRVIQNFMIQGGGAPKGSVEVNYTIPAEINPEFFHKKGALCAARLGDQVNPEKASSGSQFYIVQGRVFDEATLKAFEERMGITFPEDHKKVYSTIGGSPHLDQGYTVFGEVIDGLDVVDKIAAVPTGNANKPIEDVEMTIEIVK